MCAFYTINVVCVDAVTRTATQNTTRHRRDGKIIVQRNVMTASENTEKEDKRIISPYIVRVLFSVWRRHTKEREKKLLLLAGILSW